ncbi:heparinase II/III domain-containing protein [Paenibacillus bovis]|uniref:heparinase II/III domain-containing protein n=1 Tax=Paenibacillus bovis TaxID=1616788 RepID=UPI001D1313EE|nr:heparinase II/III family protein [Paenibacillus bovis]
MRKRLHYTAGKPEYEKWWQDIREYAGLAVSEPFPVLTFEAFREFGDTGGRERYERIYFDRRGRIGALAMMVLLASYGEQNEQAIHLLEPGEDSLSNNHTRQPKEAFDSFANKQSIEETLSAAVYIHTLEEALWDLCGEYTWCLNAHLPADSLYPVWEEIDLFAAETAGMLAELIVLLDGIVDDRIIRRMRDEVQRRVLLPAGDLSRTFGWETAEHNWSAVCGAGCGIAALLLLEDTVQQTIIIERMTKAAAQFLNGYGEDGGCAEGLGYWVYGFGYYTYFMDMLSAADFSNKLEIDHHKLDRHKSDYRKIKAIAAFPEYMHLSNGRFVNFSDSGEEEILPPGLLSRLTEITGRFYSLPFVMPALREDPCRRWAHLLRNILWAEPHCFGISGAAVADRSAESATVAYKVQSATQTETADQQPTGEKTEPEPEQKHTHRALFNHYWPDLCWVVSRAELNVQIAYNLASCEAVNAEDEVAVTNTTAYVPRSTSDKNVEYGVQSSLPNTKFIAALSAKGGHNDEPHNHNDLGSFIIHAGGENIFCDPGAGLYTQSYFAPGREQILNISSAGHSIPQINGYEQYSGRAAAAIVEVLQMDEAEMKLGLDLTAAYPAEAGLKKMRRNFHWKINEDRQEINLQLQDDFQFVQPFSAPSGHKILGGGELEYNDRNYQNRSEQISMADQTIHRTAINQVIERFMSHTAPVVYTEELIWTGSRAEIRMQIPREQYNVEVETIAHHDHEGHPVLLYRTSLKVRKEWMLNLPMQELHCGLAFSIRPLV